MANRTMTIIGIVIVVIIIAAIFFMSGSSAPSGSTTTTVQITTVQSPTTVSAPTTTVVANALPTTTVPTMPSTQTVIVNVTEWSFNPSTISIVNGTTVTFKVYNNGGYQHTFTIQNLAGSGVLVDSGYITPLGNAVITLTFTAKGNYTYFSSAPNDQLHNLKGTLIVK